MIHYPMHFGREEFQMNCIKTEIDMGMSNIVISVPDHKTRKRLEKRLGDYASKVKFSVMDDWIKEQESNEAHLRHVAWAHSDESEALK